MWTGFIYMGRGTSVVANVTKFQFRGVQGTALYLDKNV